MQRQKQPKATLQQRQAMFDYMVLHPELGKGRLPGPDGARKKKELLAELAVLLNSMGTGATKTPEKWYKSWLDWKSDVKAKSALINAARRGTGGGPPPPPLTPLENQVMEFHGPEMVEGLDVPDPLQDHWFPPVEMEVEVGEERPELMSGSGAPDAHQQRTSTATPRVGRNDPVLEVLERQARAIEAIPEAMYAVAAAMNRIADALASRD